MKIILKIMLIIPLLTFSQTIQEQINLAEEGSIINIEDGTYNETIYINKSITLNCNNNCVIDASNFVGGITVSKDAIIETVAEKILSQDKPVSVIDKNNNVVGSVKPSKIIQTVFGQGKEKK